MLSLLEMGADTVNINHLGIAINSGVYFLIISSYGHADAHCRKHLRDVENQGVYILVWY